MDAERYDYFGKDGAVFPRRVKPGVRPAPMVQDIKIMGRWEPYTGDRAAAVYFGDEISAKEAGETGLDDDVVRSGSSNDDWRK